MLRQTFGIVGIAVLGGVMLTAGPCRAGDSTKNSLANPILPTVLPLGTPDPSQVFTDCYSKGSVSTAGKKFAVKMAKTSATTTDQTHCTNDDFICLNSSTTNLGNVQF